MRGQGRVFRPKVDGKESNVWWLDYGVRGKRHRESSGTTSKRDALELLRQRIGKRKDGTLSGRPERVTLTELKDALQRHYVREGNASWPRAEQAFSHLVDYFGGVARALQITKIAVSEYQDARLGEGAARNTVCGWKTRDMFDRYNIIDSTDLSRAVAWRFNGKVTAKIAMETMRAD